MGCLQRIICCGRKDVKKKVYVIKLDHGKYYVGESINIRQRIWAHKNGDGSGWTKNHGFIKQIKTITDPQTSFWELSETLEQMNLYGINNVRGSMFTNPYSLSEGEKIMAAQLYCEKYNLCRRCGDPGHFINRCQNDSVAPWVSNFGGKLLNEYNKDTNRLCNNCNSSINNLPTNYKYCRPCFKEINNY